MHDDDFDDNNGSDFDDRNGSGWTSPGDPTWSERQQASLDYTRQSVWIGAFNTLIQRGVEVPAATAAAAHAVAEFDRLFVGK